MYNSTKLLRASSRLRQALPSQRRSVRHFAPTSKSGASGSSSKAKDSKEKPKLKRTRSQEILAAARMRFDDARESIDADIDQVTTGLASRLKSVLGRETVQDLSTLARTTTQRHADVTYRSDPQGVIPNVSGGIVP